MQTQTVTNTRENTSVGLEYGHHCDISQVIMWCIQKVLSSHGLSLVKPPLDDLRSLVESSVKAEVQNIVIVPLHPKMCLLIFYFTQMFQLHCAE